MDLRLTVNLDGCNKLIQILDRVMDVGSYPDAFYTCPVVGDCEDLMFFKEIVRSMLGVFSLKGKVGDCTGLLFIDWRIEYDTGQYK